MATIKRVGVIGAGQMGSGIAHVCALAGYDVVINDIDSQKIEDGLRVIDRNMSRQVSRGIVGELDKREAFARIKIAASLAELSDVDLAIEAATENEETKKSIFRALQPHLNPGALLASNTSSISITRLASTTDRPEHFIGLDTVLSIMNVLHEGLADSKYRPCPLLVKYVEAGWLGRKSGRGFYDYRGETPVPTR